MPYTLAKGFVWIALAVLLGIVIGWLLRSIAAKRQIARARADQTDQAELERLRGRVANLEPAVAERDRLREEVRRLSDAADAEPAAPDRAPPDESVPAADAPGSPDVAAAAAVLGRSITLDDLTVVEGIGPKIEELCHGIGIRTWFDLSTIEVSLLRTMLADAGPRFRTHDPTTWPEQAGLLAHGRWDEFVALTQRLQGGRGAD